MIRQVALGISLLVVATWGCFCIYRLMLDRERAKKRVQSERSQLDDQLKQIHAQETMLSDLEAKSRVKDRPRARLAWEIKCGEIGVRPSCCPKCGSMNVTLHTRPGHRLERDEHFTTYINATSKRCAACGHEWDRVAQRGQRVPTPPPVNRSRWTGLFQRLFAFIK